MHQEDNVCSKSGSTNVDQWLPLSLQVERAGQVVNFMDYAAAFDAAVACIYTRRSRSVLLLSSDTCKNRYKQHGIASMRQGLAWIKTGIPGTALEPGN